MTTNAEVRDGARGILESIDDETIMLHLPHTDYRLRLRLPAPAPALRSRVGKRVKGTIRGRALRIHPAAGGGRFIEPMVGEPRIVAGTLRAVDADNARVLVDVGAPMWLDTEAGQSLDGLALGGLLSCYVESGTRFEPDGAGEGGGGDA